MRKGIVSRPRDTILPPGPATRPAVGLRHDREGSHDTAPMRAVRAVWAYHARSQGQLCVHTVHLAYFWTQCTVSVTV